MTKKLKLQAVIYIVLIFYDHFSLSRKSLKNLGTLSDPSIFASCVFGVKEYIIKNLLSYTDINLILSTKSCKTKI